MTDEQREVQSAVTGNPNPIASGLSITVSVPETIEIKMVDASTLADYEIWFFIASILSGAVIGFLVAFFQENFAPIYGWMSLILFIIFVLSVIMALTKRAMLTKKSKTICLPVNG